MRFPEFTGEWRQDLMENVTERIGDGIHSTPTYNEYGDYFFINGNNLVDGKIKIFNNTQKVTKEEALKQNANVLCDNSLLLSINGTIGNVAIYNNERIMLGKSACYINPSAKILRDFLFFYLQNSKIQKYFILELTGSTIKNLSLTSIKNTKLRLPSIQEQAKIAKLLRAIDERIATQNKIIGDLKKLKSAIIDKSFCYPNESSPQKRFTDFTEEWHLVHLSDICQRVRTKNFNTQCTLVLTIAAQFGLVSQEEFFNKSVASDNLEGYYLLQKGDFAYNKSYSGDYAWGAVKRLECFSEGVLSPLYICFRPDTARIDSDFLAHYFESKKWYKGIADIAGEGARNHGLLNLSVIDYFKTLHRIPSIQEQKVIANVLNKLTSKISIEKNLYDDLLLQRQHLLQQMFI